LGSRAGQKGKAWVKAGLARLLVAHPEAGLRLAGSLGRRLGSCPGLRTAPSASEVTALLGDLPRRELARIRREIGALERQNQALFTLIRRRGMEPLLPLVRVTGEEHLARLRREGAGAILVDWHVGVPAHFAALIKLGVPTVAFGLKAQVPESHPLPDSIRLLLGSGECSSFLVLALQQLRTGGAVAVGVNGLLGEAFAEVPFLGRKTRLGRGAAALARLSGAPILPITCSWARRGALLDYTFHEPLPRPCVPKKDRTAFEDALLAATAHWFESYVRAHPEQLRLKWVRHYLADERCYERVSAG
jgi:lauroyl/myristoyl acyltransferase